MRTEPNDCARVKILLTGVTFCYFVFGYLDSIRGATITQVMDSYGIGYSGGGTVLLINFIGFTTATVLAGILADTVSKKFIILLASAIVMAGIRGYTNHGNIWLLYIGILIYGYGLGNFELGGNFIMVDIFPDNKRGKYLNIISAAHSTGAIAGPVIAGQIIKTGYSWRRVFTSAIFALVMLTLFFVLAKYPAKTYSKPSKPDLRQMAKSAFTQQVRWFYLLASACVACEVGVNSWMVDFLQKQRQFSVDKATLYLSAFFIMIVFGRFAGSFFVDRLGYYNSIGLAFIGCAACILAGVLMPASFAFLLPLSGLFHAIIFPTAIAAISTVCRENHGIILGVFFAFTGIGGMIGSWLIGYISQLMGIGFGFGTVALFCLFGIGITWRIQAMAATDAQS